MADTQDIAAPFRRALLETLPCAVVIVDGDERVIFWSPSAAELTGYDAEEMIGATCEVLHVRLSAEPDPDVVRALCPSSRRDAGQDSECEIRRKDGTIVPVLRRTRPVCDDAGETVGTIHALIDISFIRRAHVQIRELKAQIARAGGFGELVGGSPAMRKLYEAIELVAGTDAGVVVEGPTGTGKELVARTIHARSRRADGPLLAVNCGAIPESLLEAELFGHVRGAFTGAVADRAGRFEEADGGTLFLDEITEMPLASQVKLLRAVQEGEITRVGVSRPRPVDVRVIAATNRDLAEEVRAGRFRQDLYYRLRIVGLKVPPLSARREDIPDLVAHFIARLNDKYGRRIGGCSPAAMDRLTRYEFPGNVRELEHAVEHAFVVTPPDASVIGADALPAEIAGAAAGARPRHPPPTRRDPEDERAQVLDALARAAGNKSQAAQLLGISRTGLYKKLKRLDIPT